MLEQQKFFILQIQSHTNERPSPFIGEEEALNHLQKPWVRRIPWVELLNHEPNNI
jgi:hypothetical protein